MVIVAGETSVSSLFSGIADTSDENDETIILNPTITNAVLASSAALTVNLTDINDAPSVAFTFSEASIKENSNTDVTLTATLSSVSGKPVEMVFTMEGTAVETDDYVLSSKTITIPANSLSGTITVSTSTIAVDNLVEEIDTIIFRVATISNATAAEDSATLFLESIENPEVVLTVSQESIAENETFNVIATLSAAASKDVTINLETAGLAKYNIDFSSNSTTRITTVVGENGQGSNADQFSHPSGVVFDNSGNLYVADRHNNRIQKFAPGASEGVSFISGLNQPIAVSIDVNGNIYVLEQRAHQVTKWSSDGRLLSIAAGGNGQGSDADQLYNPQDLFVDLIGNVYVADRENHRIQKWAPTATEGITVAGGNEAGGGLNQLYNPTSVFVDLEGNIYIGDEAYGRIQKWAPGAAQGETILDQINSPSGIFLDANGSLYILERASHRIKKYLAGATSGVVVAGGARGSAADQLDNPIGFTFDDIGNIYVADSDNHRIQKYAISPQLVIEAGETVAASITFLRNTRYKG